MAIPRWTPPVALSADEEEIMKLVARTRKLFGFLRLHRHELFDDGFQEELAAMYRDTGAGAVPVAPALMCMVLLLQGYTGSSDVDAVQDAAADARWQLVLGTLSQRKAPFSQGGLQQFRERLIAHDLDRRLLERTVDLAKRTRMFDWKKLPKTLRVGVDSRPLVGAGKVEDTFNLLGHAARKIAECAAELSGLSIEDVCARAHAPVLLSSSVKAGLDVDWTNDVEKEGALNELFVQVSSLSGWVGRALGGEGLEGPITKYLEALQQIQEQDLVDLPDGRVRLLDGVAPDRRTSIEDGDMRHGRKSKSKAFTGFKEHVAVDLDRQLVLAAIVTSGNLNDGAAAPLLEADLAQLNLAIGELYVDLAYGGSALNDNVERGGGTVVSKPWPVAHPLGLFSKTDFDIDLDKRSIMCPGGQKKPFELGDVVVFDGKTCDQCRFDAQCRQSTARSGRTVQIAADEDRQFRLRALQATKAGKEKLRRRTGVEHRQAHIAAKKGCRARYRGTRKNTFDLRRTAAVTNLEVAQRPTCSAL